MRHSRVLLVPFVGACIDGNTAPVDPPNHTVTSSIIATTDQLYDWRWLSVDGGESVFPGIPTRMVGFVGVGCVPSVSLGGGSAEHRLSKNSSEDAIDIDWSLTQLYYGAALPAEPFPGLAVQLPPVPDVPFIPGERPALDMVDFQGPGLIAFYRPSVDRAAGWTVLWNGTMTVRAWGDEEMLLDVGGDLVACDGNGACGPSTGGTFSLTAATPFAEVPVAGPEICFGSSVPNEVTGLCELDPGALTGYGASVKCPAGFME